MSIDKSLSDKLLAEIKVITGKNADVSLIQKQICVLLKNKVNHYDWVGFYLVAPDKPDELILGPYEGAVTDHTRIKFGQGICGQAADSGGTFIVDDVSKEANYLSCSINVKSEIVLPIFYNDKLLGELDIDSHQISAFDDSDNRFLSQICIMVSEFM